jgi:ketosteroid isomerase-like protein
MKRTSVFVTIGFLAGLGTGFFAHSAGVGRLLRKDPHAADLAAIEKLHQIDIEFTRSQDYKRLMDIWSEDAVRFMPGSPPDVGKQAILADNEKFAAEYPGFKVLRYAAKYKNIQIEDGLACEWGEHESQFKMSPEAPPVSWHGTGFHVLKRQSDGSWKFAVMILNQ